MLPVANPPQTIVILQHNSYDLTAYVRYRRKATTGWELSGAFSPFVKYFKPEYRLVQTPSRPFFVVTGQGAAGVGVSSKLEYWIDLSRSEFN